MDKHTQVSCLNCRVEGMSYFLLDANILIEAKYRMPIDLFPTFWEKLRVEIEAGHIFTSEKVKDEINRGNEDDELVEWISHLPESFFIGIDGGIMINYAQVINWANQNEQYYPAAKAEFANAQIADAFLIATAKAKDMILVTHEVSDLNAHKRVKIPDAASAMEVSCSSLVEMLRSLRVTI